MVTTVPPVFLHLGFGTQAAGNFHNFLFANRAGLSLEGFDVGAAGSFDPGRDLRPRNSDLRGLMLSDPCFHGADDGLMSGRFFPAVADRADALADRLGRPVSRLVVTLQPYDKLFRAAWRRAALGRPVTGFADHAERLAAVDGCWSDLVTDLTRRLGAETTTVIAVAPSNRRMLAALVPGLSLPFPAPHDAAPQPTESAVAMAQRHLRLGARFAPGQLDRLIAFHARQPQDALPPDYAGLHAADLRGRYVADLGTLARTRGMVVEAEALPQPEARQAIAAE
jgi:hypothetical protein